MTKAEVISIAALLHDIGKFSWQAGERLDRENENTIKVKHLHARHGASFVKKYFAQLNNVADIILSHHEPESANDSYAAKIVSLANVLSWGGNEEIPDDAYSKLSNEPLVSIFSQMRIFDKFTQSRYYPVLPLDLNLEPLFPKQKKEEVTKIREGDNTSFHFLWERFTKEIARIDHSKPFEFFINQLVYLLEKYTLFLPAMITGASTNQSLFHHLKSTAAIASCVQKMDYEMKKLESSLDEISALNIESQVLSENTCNLIGGDISGIQDFIYSITSENALKGLRGRSVYLQLLTESVAKTFINKLKLTTCNIIFIGGGHFYLIAPASKDCEQVLKEMRDIVDQNLLQAHHGKLYLTLAHQPLRWKDFLGNNFGLAFENLKKELSRDKKRKFHSFIADEKKTEMIFGPYEEGGENKACPICAEELPMGTSECQLCESYAQLAGKLARSKCFVEITTKAEALELLTPQKTNWEKVLNSLGTTYHFYTEIKEGVNSYILNSTKFLKNDTITEGYRFLSQRTPLKANGEIKTLEDLANESANATRGIKTWGVFRADVDQLGHIFGQGIGEGRTIAKVSMLSHFISLFFSAHVEWIAQQQPFDGRIYLVYAGGDDMFVIGAWSELPAFAQRIYNDFRQFTCQHPAITLSGSIFLAPSKKFPVYQAAASAGEFLDDAKNKGRDNLSLFGESIPWNKLADLKKLVNQIEALLEPPGNHPELKVSRALLNILRSGWSEKKRSENEKGKISLFRVWRLLYAFKRLKKRHPKRKLDLDNLEQAIITYKRNLRPYLDVAVRWAEYLTR